ncbi:hypothetical protein C7974DRAFT_389126 [Boeremia exigua]|uniref:uncharacterized protein n=1 Tax=Boeremia exigua TaxID=749465 RepID=UPI001E8E2244|nr:uncharacterized protein C7974DRAFT_389126 [Boeremia exigua]KAH6639750.1 hypothetical protein C7974DRAFT_389126 [Boeremia exigua]
MALLVVLLSLLAAVAVPFVFFPAIVRFLGALVGRHLRRSSSTRRELLLARVASEARAYRAAHPEGDDWEEIASAADTPDKPDTPDPQWDGIVGFFHPFCNAGGGGERVLWAAIRATQKRWPNAVCVVYTGDHDVDKAAILKRVEDRFNIHLHPPTIHFLYLTTRHWVLATTWPRFTLLGQSLGSLVLAYDAFSLLVPDIFVDTMGYAFALALSSCFFPAVPTGAYVHYPTISTDMLDSLQTGGQGVNAGAGTGYRGAAKQKYWQLFAQLYSRVGSTIDVVMTNSTWTQAHVSSLWGPSRRRTTSPHPDIDVVFPPVAVEEVTSAIPLTPASPPRDPTLLYIAQFRPEKNHALILRAFALFLRSAPAFPAYPGGKPHLVLIGSVRDSLDEKSVYALRLLAHELHIKDRVTFLCDAPWPAMLRWMGRASVGVNGMWNEHFGIGVVEYQAAGLISVVNDSGGPKIDIAVEVDGGATGFHATTVEDYADGFSKALSLSPQDTLAMRLRARKSAGRFTDAAFAEKWLRNMDKLVRLQVQRASK